MKLSELICVMEGKNEGADAEKEVVGLSFDSRTVKDGDLFFCKGEGFKKEYAAEALRKGAVAVVTDHSLRQELKVPTVKVLNTEKSMALASAHFYGYPMKRLISVAVTGTKGKSTVCAFLNRAINAEKGHKCALLSELAGSEGGRLTTPEAVFIHSAAAKAVKEGYTHLVCEISSQAVKRDRVYGIEFDYGCFTGYGRDHIGKGEHKDEAEYFACKLALMQRCKSRIVNVTAPEGREMLKELKKNGTCISASAFVQRADIYAKKINFGRYGCVLSVINRENGALSELAVRGVGAVNADNALTALACGRAMGLSERSVFIGCVGAKTDGRSEIFRTHDGKIAIAVDYAHNGISFTHFLKNAEKAFKGAFVHVIFGSAGDKARCRRGDTARVCAAYADRVTVCEDDSGREGFEGVSRDITEALFEAAGERGARLTEIGIRVIKSRAQALETAMRIAKDDGGKHLILMLGKGAEALNRGYGCDEKCIPDTSLAENAIKEYDFWCDTEGRLKDVALRNRRLLVCLDGEKSIKAFAASITELRLSGVSVCAVCNEGLSYVLESECFKNGIAVRSLFSVGRADVKAARSVSGMGQIAVFFSKNTSITALAVADAMKFTDIVYFEDKKGIIFKEDVSIRSVSREMADAIFRGLGEEGERRICEAVKRAERVAVINGTQPRAIASYLLSGEGDGTVIRKKNVKI